jgi:RimJ/RimL family protein N-acetyltransferase
LEVSDAGRYQTLRLRALKEHPSAFSSSYEEQRDRPASFFAERLSRSFGSPDAFNLGCFVDDHLVGTVGFFREEGAKVMHRAWIVGMHVAAEHQGKGYGRALLLAAIERARQMPRLALVQLGVESNNEAAISLYSSLGFKTYGLEKRALLVDGEYLDEDLMALDLD